MYQICTKISNPSFTSRIFRIKSFISFEIYFTFYLLQRLVFAAALGTKNFDRSL